MAQHRPFRFGIFSHNTAPLDTLVAQARKAEQLGYATFLVPDHIGDQFASVLALQKVAEVTSMLRIGSFVFDNDFRHPALLAKDAATLDVFSNGRFELGMGAGWMQSEYEQCGISFDSPKIRIDRLEESLRIIKPLLLQEKVTFTGNHYKVNQLRIQPHPVQYPSLPIFIGGSGKRLLSLAGRVATIVGFTPKTRASQVEGHMNHALDLEDASATALAQKVEWVRQSAGTHFSALELNIVVLDLVVSSQWQDTFHTFLSRYSITEEQVLQSPHFLVGSVEQVCSKIQEVREHFGISYWVVWEEHLEQFAPVVQRLAQL